eukprot:3228884-Rhodomonas_salina.3
MSRLHREQTDDRNSYEARPNNGMAGRWARKGLAFLPQQGKAARAMHAMQDDELGKMAKEILTEQPTRLNDVVQCTGRNEDAVHCVLDARTELGIFAPECTDGARKEVSDPR